MSMCSPNINENKARILSIQIIISQSNNFIKRYYYFLFTNIKKQIKSYNYKGKK